MIGITAVRGEPEALPWTSTINPTDNFLYLERLLSLWPADDDYLFLGEVPRVSPEALVAGDFEGPELALRLGFFPGRPSYTDLLAPLRQTLLQFTDMRAQGIQGSYAVFIFTDGVANCPRNCEEKSFLGTTLEEPNSCVKFCNNSYDNFLHSTVEIMNEIWDDDGIGDVPIHVISFHPDSHTLGIVNPEDGNSCYDDAKFRASFGNQILSGDASFVGADINPYESFASFRSGEGPFHSANVFGYTLAALTSGSFFPLRPVSPNCSPGTACEFIGEPPQFAGQPLALSPGDPFPSDQEEINNYRVLYDPGCRNLTTQIQDAINEILGNNPFVNIEVPPAQP
jgi:hypothetical protein